MAIAVRQFSVAFVIAFGDPENGTFSGGRLIAAPTFTFPQGEGDTTSRELIQHALILLWF